MFSKYVFIALSASVVDRSYGMMENEDGQRRRAPAPDADRGMPLGGPMSAQALQQLMAAASSGNMPGGAWAGQGYVGVGSWPQEMSDGGAGYQRRRGGPGLAPQAAAAGGVDSNDDDDVPAGGLGGSGGAPGGVPPASTGDADHTKEIKEFLAKDEAKDVDFSKLTFTDPDDKVDKSVVEKAKTLAKRALALVNKHEGTKCPMRKLMFQFVNAGLTNFISVYGDAIKNETKVSFERFKTDVSNIDTILKIVETLDEDKDTIKRLKTTVLIVGLCLGLGLPLLFGGVTFALFKTGKITWALSAAASEVPAAGV